MAIARRITRDTNTTQGRGAVAFERKVDLSDRGTAAVFERLNAGLKGPLAKYGHLVSEEKWAMNILDHNDLYSAPFGRVPSTGEIIEQISGLNEGLRVRIGAIGLFGGLVHSNLGVALHSDTAHTQRKAVEAVYKAHGIGIREPNSHFPGYLPHIPVGDVEPREHSRLKHQAALDSLTEAAGVIGSTVLLLPATPALPEVA
jgi:hypothetical protein